MSMKTTRDEAIEAGDVRYYTGKPCIRGHIAPRYTTNTLCVACDAARQKERMAYIMSKREKVGKQDAQR